MTGQTGPITITLINGLDMASWERTWPLLKRLAGVWYSLKSTPRICPLAPPHQKARLSLNYRLRDLEPVRNNGWVILNRQWQRWLPLTHRFMRLMTYQPVYWHKQSDSSLLKPRVSLTFSFHVCVMSFALSLCPPFLSVVVAKVREAQWERAGSRKGEGEGGLNKSLSCQDVLLPRFV